MTARGDGPGSVKPKRRRSCLRGCGWALIVAVFVLVLSYIGVCRHYQGKVDAKLRQLKAAGLPIGGTDLQPPPVPEAQNAAPLYLEAADLVEPKSGAALKPPDAYNAKGPPTPDDVKAIAEFVGHFDDALELIHEATNRPQCQFAVDWSDPPAALFPHLARMRAVARFLRAEAMVASHRGDEAEALERVRMGFVASRQLSGEAVLITALVGCATDAIMLRAADHVVTERPIPPMQGRALAEELLRLDYGEWTGRAMRSERVLGISAFGHLRAGDYGIAGPTGAAKRSLLWVHSRAFPVWSAEDELYYLRTIDELARVTALTPKQRAADPAAQAALAAHTPRWAVGSNIVVPLLMRVLMRAEATAARRAVLATGLGVEVYRGQHGQYPKRLADLQSLNWPMAKDVFSDGELVYRQSGSGFVLYSIGPDLTDDGGTPPSDIAKVTDERNVDIVWTATGR
jgi:hypothetical protein